LSFLVFSAYPFIIARRIILEEELLLKELDGYYEYTQRVKYRLIPFIW
jgi:protein-S-isoprenylcysteine O-methyltransferase Ste14